MRQGSSERCLSLKEKIAVTLMLLVLATFAGTSFAKRHQKLSVVQKNIYIKCIGECTEAPIIELPTGAKVSDLLARINLTEDADISKLVLERHLTRDETFIVPKKEVLTLYVTGAVETPGLIYIPEGLRFNQLTGYISCTDNADLGLFRRRRRMLSEGETIHVPAKSEYIVRK